jgi:hypothetical protein
MVWLLCAGWIASLLPTSQPGPDPIAAALDVTFALLLSVLGQRILQQPRPSEPKPAASGVMAPALSGLALMLGRGGRAALAHLSSWVVPRQRGINASVCFVLALVLALRALARA